MAVRLNDADVACQACSSFVATDLWAVSRRCLPKDQRQGRVTDPGLRLALFFTRVHARLFRPGLSVVMPDVAQDDAPLRRAFAHLEHAMDQWCAKAKLAA